jgi:hypothetical protein
LVLAAVDIERGTEAVMGRKVTLVKIALTHHLSYREKEYLKSSDRRLVATHNNSMKWFNAHHISNYELWPLNPTSPALFIALMSRHRKAVPPIEWMKATESKRVQLRYSLWLNEFIITSLPGNITPEQIVSRMLCSTQQ